MFPINIDFDNSTIPLEIAFCFPYKHEEMLDDIREMEKRFKSDKQIFVYKEILIKSYEGLDVPCLTISSHHLKLDSLEGYETINGTSRCNKFDQKKPVI